MAPENLVDEEEQLLKLSVDQLDRIFDRHFHFLAHFGIEKLDWFRGLLAAVEELVVLQFDLPRQVQVQSLESVLNQELDPG